MKRFIGSLILSMVLMLSGASAQEAPEDIRFFLTFVPNVQFSPLYAAIANEHAADNGLAITIEHGDEPVGVDLIAAGEIPFGMISGEQVIMARASERPVVYVYEWFQQYPVAIVVPDTTEGVETVADLAGQTVGIPGRFGASYSGLTALLAANDMQETDIELQPIGFVAPDIVCAGRVDASVVYINNEPLQIQQRADAGECGDIETVTLLPVAAAADMVSNGIVTNEATIEDNPELVQAVVTAFDRGLRDVINNPAQAYLVSLDYVENLPINDDFRTALTVAAAEQAGFLMAEPDREAIAERRAELLAELQTQFDGSLLIQFEVLLATIDLWDAERPGYSDVESWEITQEVIESMGLLPREIDLSAAFTNAFLPEEDEG